MIKTILLPLCFLWCMGTFAQKKLTIQGYVQDASSDEKIVSVTIWSPFQKKGTVTNNYGYFSMTFAKDSASVLFTATGYKYKEIFFDENNSDSILIIRLEKLKISKEEVRVVGTKERPIQERTLMGQITVPIEQIKAMPRFLGEADVLKAIQLLPGIQQGTEGTSGLLVRGGGPDQNLILLDGTPVYNTQHLFGIFSNFNADAIKNVEVYKGGFPARFGGRLSSVIDIVTKDGDMHKVHGEASIALIMSRFTLEGPIKKGKTSFLIGARRSYLDVLAQPFIKKAARDEGIDLNFGAFIYDVNLKVNHIVSKKDRLFLTFFSSQDFLKFKVKENFNGSSSEQRLRLGYGNLIGTFRWNHIYNKKLFSNTIINYTNYRFTTGIELSDKDPSGSSNFAAKYYSGIYDIGGNMNFDYRPNATHAIKFGGGILHHVFTPGAASVKVTDNSTQLIDTAFNTKRQGSLEGNVYFEDDWEITSKFKANLGVHTSFFQAKTKFYPSIQPRIGLRYLLPKDWAVKLGYTRMAQFIHLLTNSTTTLPTDLWVPSTDRVKPMRSQQIALGVAKTIWNNQFEASIEGYYKTMDGVIEYKDGASYLNSSTDDWDTKVEQGKGLSRGIEFLLQKKSGRTTGWFGYTLSKSDRTFEQINFGKTFPYKYDRRHDVELVVIHKINKKWEISGNWGFSTANNISLPLTNYATANINSPYDPSGFGFNGNQTIDYYNGRNGFRLLNYHRLDFGITHTKQKKRYTKIWNLSFYNLYNRKNPFYYYLDYVGINQEGTVKAITLLPIIPNLSFTIKF
jgi:hypothetical protein